MFKQIRALLLKLLCKLNPSVQVHYINGPELLPPPLSKDEEMHLLARYSNGDETVRDKLIVHNLRLVVYIARKFEGGSSNVEDLISIGTIGLIKAVKTFCPDRNIKLATYASRCIENEILMHLRKTSSLKAEVSIDEPLNVDWDGNELLLSDVLGSDGEEVNRGIETDDEARLLHSLIDKLNPREKLIMQLRFGFDGYKEHTQKEVADQLGISQSYISRLEKKIIERLKQEIEYTERCVTGAL
jgi:RNA polymerase sporulation-specific sigma factor